MRRNTDLLQISLLPPGSRVLCAVSGGVDSMCLLHLLSQREELSLVCAHFNHQLRGEESDRDEAFVRDMCKQWNIPLTVGRGDVEAFARREKLSLEEAGRTLRYAFLYQAAEEELCDWIATAHNAEDNAETLLLHLLRGSGLNGLTGISPQRGKLVRPLLTTSRKEIEAYLIQHDIPHREDSTNADDAYTRNRVRHQLLPLLEEMNPGFVRRLTSAIPRLRADNDYLNDLARQLLTKTEHREDGLVLPAALLSQAPAPVASRAVRLLLAQAAGGNWDCSAAHLEAVLELCRSSSPSAQVSLPHGLTARREYGLLVLAHDLPAQPLEPMPLQEGDNPVPGLPWTVVLQGPPWPGLVVRSRQTGDSLTLPGGHTKTLKKLFIDQKLPRRERERRPVVADNDGVIAVAGVGPNLSHPCHGQVRMIQYRKGEDMHDEHER